MDKFTFEFREYGGSPVCITLRGNSQTDAERKARAIMELCGEIIDIDEGYALVEPDDRMNIAAGRVLERYLPAFKELAK